MIAWWWLARFPDVRLIMMVAASYLFYGWWNWHFTALLAFSTLLDWLVGIGIERSTDRRRKFAFLMVSIAGNLGVLAYFKYTGFMASAINDVLTALRTGTMLPVPQIILPVGISFYTFQTLTYSIDLYRGQVQSAKSLLHFAAYVSMFPQLIAGPIVRYSDVENRLRQLPTKIDWNQAANGIWFFIVGMTQKVLVADSLASFGTPLLEDPTSMQFFGAWFALLSYTGQLYFDFAGYSNMACGLGLLLGIEFPQNFDSPYQAISIQDFWRRWHITLSQFLRDYLYIPLGGNRYGKAIMLRNLLLVMILGGVWHGAGWTFIVWGVWHGVLLAGYAWYRETTERRMPRWFALPLTFFCVVIGWLFFRSTDMAMAGEWLSALIGVSGIEPDFGRNVWLTFGASATIAALLFCFIMPNCWRFRPRLTWSSSITLASLLVVCILRFDSESPFLYFQF